MWILRLNFTKFILIEEIECTPRLSYCQLSINLDTFFFEFFQLLLFNLAIFLLDHLITNFIAFFTIEHEISIFSQTLNLLSIYFTVSLHYFNIDFLFLCSQTIPLFFQKFLCRSLSFKWKVFGKVIISFCQRGFWQH